MRLLPLLALLLVPLAAPATAAALDVTADGRGYIEVKGGDGEANDVSVVRDGTAVVVTDTGAPLVLGPGCERRDDGSARCAVPEAIGAGVVETGDGDDVVRVTLTQEDEIRGELGAGNDRLDGAAGSLWFFGGDGDDAMTDLSDGAATFEAQAGNDRVDGGPGGDDVSGGSGDDVVLGGPGADRLRASDKDDESTFADQGRGNDTYDGGDGTDIVSYQDRLIGVKVDLADPAPDGGAGEADTLAGIENVQGSDGSDVLNGDDRANVLLGAGGGDVLDGRGGNDTVYAGPSQTQNNLGIPKPDRAEGGPGNDSVRSQEEAFLSGGPGHDELSTGVTATATCGTGNDYVIVTPATTPPLDRTCERWQFTFATVPELGRATRMILPRIRGNAMRQAVLCGPVEKARCDFTLRVTTTSGRVLGIGRAVLKPGQQQTLLARLRSRPSTIRVLVLLKQEGGRRIVKAGVTVPSR